MDGIGINYRKGKGRGRKVDRKGRKRYEGIGGVIKRNSSKALGEERVQLSCLYIPVTIPGAVADLPREHKGTQTLVFRQVSRV
jgi:hypothetical protein